MLHRRSKNKNKEQGFTLVELSIVLVILGLLVGGVISGVSLIHSSQVTSTISSIRDHVTAYNIFREKYGCVPGDCIKSTRYFEDSENGDGNGLISCQVPVVNCTAPINEQVMAVQTMQQAGLIKGGGFYNTSADSLIEVALNNCKMQFYATSNYDSPIENNLRIFHPLNVSPWSDDCMTPQEAHTIDIKVDDGNPSMGLIFGRRVTSGAQSECVSTNHWNPPSKDAEYNVQNDKIICVANVRL